MYKILWQVWHVWQVFYVGRHIHKLLMCNVYWCLESSECGSRLYLFSRRIAERLVDFVLLTLACKWCLMIESKAAEWSRWEPRSRRKAQSKMNIKILLTRKHKISRGEFLLEQKQKEVQFRLMNVRIRWSRF